MPFPPRLLRELVDVVGERHVLTEPDQVVSYTTDWTGRFCGHSAAVVRPASTQEVGAVLGACSAAGVATVPQGGNTGLVGGGVPMDGELVVSLGRLRQLEMDGANGQATVGAGAIVGDLQRGATESGWAYGVDLGSRDSATVGGTIATNAGGLRVLRYGDTRAQLLGIEAVLGTGDVISQLSGLRRDNTGYPLASLLCGSEGTLGIVTAARLRLVAPSTHRVVALMAMDSEVHAADAASDLRRQVRSLSAVELFVRSGLALVCETLELAPPFRALHPAYLLIECAGGSEIDDELATAVEALSHVMEVAVATDGPRMADLWRYREAHTEAINRLGAPHKLDVAVPPERLGAFLEQVVPVVSASAPQAKTWLFGHAGDGSVHVNLTGLAPDNEAPDDAVLGLVVSLGGSISAEHGIGTAKKAWLARTKGPGELAAMTALKRTFDPKGICNPNVLLSSSERRTSPP